MNKSWISLPRYHRKYAEGVWDFMQYVQANADGSDMFYSPCKMRKCRNDMHRFPFDTEFVLRIGDEDSTFIDVDPNEETDDDSNDKLRHRLPDINSDTEEDSSDDSDYEP
ncbi:hypothetical protein ACLB2K_031879 [Fragaria x ananassa]